MMQVFNPFSFLVLLMCWNLHSFSTLVQNSCKYIYIYQFVVLRHLLYLYFVTRKAFHDILPVVVLDSLESSTTMYTTHQSLYVLFTIHQFLYVFVCVHSYMMIICIHYIIILSTLQYDIFVNKCFVLSYKLVHVILRYL